MRTLSTLATFVLIVSASACGGDGDGDTTATATATTTATATATATGDGDSTSDTTGATGDGDSATGDGDGTSGDGDGTTGDGDGCAAYGNPATGCCTGETPIGVQGLQGGFCSPACTGPGTCPASTAGQADCVLQDGMGGMNCGIICMDLAGSSDCPTDMTCEDLMMMGLGLCTYLP